MPCEMRLTNLRSYEKFQGLVADLKRLVCRVQQREVDYYKNHLVKNLINDQIKVFHPLEIVDPFSNISPSIGSRKTGS